VESGAWLDHKEKEMATPLSLHMQTHTEVTLARVSEAWAQSFLQEYYTDLSRNTVEQKPISRI
jgi:hypothetical protein